MFRCSLWNGVLALACLLLGGCRGADVVMYDAVSNEIVWKSIGTESEWRECFPHLIDSDNQCFHTMQYVEKKKRVTLRTYGLDGALKSEKSFDSDIYLGSDTFIVSGGRVYYWKYYFVDNGAVYGVDHKELRWCDPNTGRSEGIAFPDKGWGDESCSQHFAYCNDGIVVLARHELVDKAYYEGVIKRTVEDGNGLFRVRYDGTVEALLVEKDESAERLELVDGWSAKYFAAKHVSGDLQVYDGDCKKVCRVNLKDVSLDLSKAWLGRVAVWADDSTIVYYNSMESNKAIGKWAIDVPSGRIRRLGENDYPGLSKYDTRVRGTLMLKERF